MVVKQKKGGFHRRWDPKLAVWELKQVKSSIENAFLDDLDDLGVARFFRTSLPTLLEKNLSNFPMGAMNLTPSASPPPSTAGDLLVPPPETLAAPRCPQLLRA